MADTSTRGSSSRCQAGPVAAAASPQPPTPAPAPASTRCHAEQCGHSTPSPSPPSASASASAAPASPPLRPPSELELKVRAIQKSERSSEEKGVAIHALFAAQRELASAVQRKAIKRLGVFPGASARRGCDHYSRNCWIRAACCDRYYPCRRCHDAAEDHEIDRRATKTVACAACGDAEQPVAGSCRTCGIRFARYFCEPCRLYDDSKTTNAYHCKDCGICRVGKGLGIDNYHCKLCTTCVPVKDKDTHPCRERNFQSNCPICGNYLAASTEQAIFLRCSHPIHVSCLEKHYARSYVCPVCSKCIPYQKNMNAWYRKLDVRLAQDRIPEGYQNRVSRVLCNDCETKTVARFHFQFHRCKDCHGYNTRVLQQYDVDPADLPPPLGGDPEPDQDAPPVASEPEPAPVAVQQTVEDSAQPLSSESHSDADCVAECAVAVPNDNCVNV